MHRRLWILASVLMFGLHGCGGGGGSQPPANGRAILNQMVTGQQPANQQNFQTAMNLFQQALQQNPTSSDARFGAAICLAGLVAQQFNSAGYVVGGAGGSGAGSGAEQAPGNGSMLVPPAPPGYAGPPSTVPPPATGGLFWNLGQVIADPFSLLQTLSPVADLRYGLLPYFGYPGDDVAGRQKMLASLTTVDQDLQAIEADSSFTTTLPDPRGSGATLTVGLPEVYLFDAYVNSMRAQVALSLAYVRDTGSSSGQNGASTGTGASGGSSSSGLPLLTTTPAPPIDTNHDGKLEPNEYLPPSPFLTLRDSSLMTLAQQAIQAEVNDETAGINGVFSRPADGSGGFLVPNSSNIHAQLANIQTSTLPLLQQALHGAVTIQVPQYSAQPQVAFAAAASGKSTSIPSTQRTLSRLVFSDYVIVLLPPIGGGLGTPPTLISVTLDLAAWFANPPADLKVFAPTYPLDANGYPVYNQAVYPDPTFGGLFPNGLPSSLLF